MTRETIVSDAPISNPRAPFYKALKAAMRVFTKQGIELELEEHGPSLDFDLMSFVHRPTMTRVHVWDDYRAKVKFLEIEGRDQEMVLNIRDTLTKALKPPTTDQLLAKAKRSRSDPTALMRAVYAAGDEHDDRVIDVVTKALGHKQAYMRELAAYGVGILGWRELGKPLKDALKKERDKEAAEVMRRSVKTIGTSQRPKPT